MEIVAALWNPHKDGQSDPKLIRGSVMSSSAWRLSNQTFQHTNRSQAGVSAGTVPLSDCHRLDHEASDREQAKWYPVVTAVTARRSRLCGRPSTSVS